MFQSHSPLLTSAFSGTALILFAICTLAYPGSASAARWNFTENDAIGADFKNCGIEMMGSDLIRNSDGGGGGLGIIGGILDAAVDSGEDIEFVFDAPAFGIQYAVMLHLPGSTFIEAFDANDNSLGIQIETNEPGVHDVSALYPGLAISRIKLTISVGEIILSWIEYAETGEVAIDFSRAGDSRTDRPVLDYCGVQFLNPSGVNTFSNGSIGGIGVRGGFNDYLTDPGETLSLEFPYPVDELRIDSLLLDLDGDLQFGEGFLIAYDTFNQQIGIASFEALASAPGSVEQSLDVSSLFPGEQISFLDLVSTSDARRLDRVVYAPEPTGAAGIGAMALTLLARRRTGRRQSPWNPSGDPSDLDRQANPTRPLP
ncbi:MAG: hypothetical protein AB8G23_21905 [Myxococcota bacterium]